MDWSAWTALGPQAWGTLALVLVVLGVLAFTAIGTDVVLVAAVTVLMLTGVLTPDAALAGMANEGMLTVAALYVVVAGLEATGGTTWLAGRVLGRPRSIVSAMVKMIVPVTVSSAFLNNTPVVAMFMPVINDWARQQRLPVSKLMIPLSYAAVLGGCCTLIGTSTNLVVNGLLIAANRPGMNMFDLAWAGLPCAVLGTLLLIAAHRWLIPDRQPAISRRADFREYTVEMEVDPGGPLVGQTIEKAGLRHLPRMFVAELEREGQLMVAVAPDVILRGGDRLTFVGVVDAVVDLQKIRGLRPATKQIAKLEEPRPQRVLVEAVVAPRCPLVGRTIRDGRFRTVYNAVVIAVARDGERIRRKIGDIVLQPGDTLLLEARPGFVERERNSRHFYLVSRIENSSPPRHERALVALAILVAMVLVVSLEWLSMFLAALLAGGLMLLTRCCTGAMARRSVDWQVLIAIAASLALGRAVESTGLADAIAKTFISTAQGSPWLTLVAIYALALVLTELVTNNAAAVLVFPIAMEAAAHLNVSYQPYVLAVALAASLGFATPLGYQTHMMVYGPGGYRFADFLRAGLPLDFLCGLITVLVLPLVFPFQPA